MDESNFNILVCKCVSEFYNCLLKIAVHSINLMFSSADTIPFNFLPATFRDVLDRRQFLSMAGSTSSVELNYFTKHHYGLLVHLL